MENFKPTSWEIRKEDEKEDKTILHGYPAYPFNEDESNKDIQDNTINPDDTKSKDQTSKSKQIKIIK